MSKEAVDIIWKEIPYKIESCIVCSGKGLYISLYKESSEKARKNLISKGLEMLSNNKKFFIE